MTYNKAAFQQEGSWESIKMKFLGALRVNTGRLTAFCVVVGAKIIIQLPKLRTQGGWVGEPQHALTVLCSRQAGLGRGLLISMSKQGQHGQWCTADLPHVYPFNLGLTRSVICHSDGKHHPSHLAQTLLPEDKRDREAVSAPTRCHVKSKGTLVWSNMLEAPWLPPNATWNVHQMHCRQTEVHVLQQKGLLGFQHERYRLQLPWR